jgi:hypothetical protein
VRVVAVAVARVAVEAQVVEEVVTLEDRVVLDDPVIALVDEGLEDGGGEQVQAGQHAVGESLEQLGRVATDVRVVLARRIAHRREGRAMSVPRVRPAALPIAHRLPSAWGRSWLRHRAWRPRGSSRFGLDPRRLAGEHRSTDPRPGPRAA